MQNSPFLLLLLALSSTSGNSLSALQRQSRSKMKKKKQPVLKVSCNWPFNNRYTFQKARSLLIPQRTFKCEKSSRGRSTNWALMSYSYFSFRAVSIIKQLKWTLIWISNHDSFNELHASSCRFFFNIFFLSFEFSLFGHINIGKTEP